MGQVPDDIRNAVLHKFAGAPLVETPEDAPEKSSPIEAVHEQTVARQAEVVKLEAELRKRKDGDTKANFSMEKPESKDLGESALTRVMKNRAKQLTTKYSVAPERRKRCTENVNMRLLKGMLGNLMP